MNQQIDGSQRRQHNILPSPTSQCGYVYEFHCGISGLFWTEEGRKDIQTWIGDLDDTNIGFQTASSGGTGCSFSSGKNIKYGSFAYGLQANDPSPHVRIKP
jgi:hypothetical protein